MKEIVRLFILLFVFVMFVFFITKFIKHNNSITKRLGYIPNFSCKTLKNNTFTKDSLNNSLPKLFIYFNSECEYCNEITKQVSNSLELLDSLQVIFISSEKTEAIETFAMKHNLLHKKNIVFLMDFEMKFSKTIDAQTVPYMLIYNKDNSLKKNFKGSTTISKVIMYLD